MDEPRRETALDTPDAKIWRYMDLPKFVSLLSRRALFFASVLKFDDPYEGWMPRSYIEAMSGLNQSFVDQHNSLRGEVAKRYPGADLTALNKGMDESLVKYAEHAKNALHEVRQRFGVSCWHKNEYESEAMWRSYPAQSVAIESTVGRLHGANRTDKNVIIENVRYMDFDRDPIERGYSQIILVLKRKSFEHEREVRAIVMLGDGHKGQLLDYDIDSLISHVHISPRADEPFRHAVADVLGQWAPALTARLSVSRLYETPDYGIELKLT
jgi:hypothetical protein